METVICSECQHPNLLTQCKTPEQAQHQSKLWLMLNANVFFMPEIVGTFSSFISTI